MFSQCSRVLLLVVVCGMRLALAGVSADVIHVVAEPTGAGQLGMIQWRVELAGAYQNPFDPDEVELTANIVGPSGKRYAVPGFYGQDYELKKGNGTEALVPRGQAGWILRFTPVEPGAYTGVLMVKDRTGQRSAALPPLVAAASKDDGFIRLDKGKRYFVRDGGGVFFPLGHNAAWFLTKPVASYESCFARMEQAGENTVRIWTADWSLGPESRWKNPLGRYDLQRAWELDQVLDAAETHHLAVILTLLVPGDYAEDFDKNSPYSAKVGGPCLTGQDFFTNAAARKFFQRRLRYTIARYAHHRNLLAWELWNEVDGIWGKNYPSNIVVPWHQVMSQFIKQLDPYGHLVTTSFAYRQRDPAVWQLADIDFTQSHIYSAPEEYGTVHLPTRLAEYSWPKWREFGKPTLVGEFGCHPRGGWTNAEDGGVALHNGLWSGALAGAAGVPLYWWWDYVETADLYGQFAAVSVYLKDVPWATEDFRPVKAAVSSKQLWAIGLVGKTVTLLWVQNRNNTFYNTIDKVPVTPVAGTVTIPLPPGAYRVERWDTYQGKVVAMEDIQAGEAGLVLAVPAITTDLAYKVHRR